MNGEPSKHLHPLPAPANRSACGLSTKDLVRLWQKNTGLEPPDLKQELIREVAETLWVPSNLDSQEADNKIAVAILRLAEIQPQDAPEGMLAVEMVATHSAAMDCLLRAARPNVVMAERDTELRLAQKLLQLFAHQFEVLDKHRGRGGRTVTVKHDVSHSYDFGTAEPSLGVADGGVGQVPRLTETKAVQIDLSALQSRAGEPVRTGGQM